MKIKVCVVQTEKCRYFDDEKQRMVEYDATNEIKGEFSDWEQVESFTNNVLTGFKNSTVKIAIDREGE